MTQHVVVLLVMDMEVAKSEVLHQTLNGLKKKVRFNSKAIESYIKAQNRILFYFSFKTV